ncbi:hypothetical protein ACFY12_34520 [Streptomyces sp. NPDC001339]|uniref:hypothetical protein n=1 Tax=Streptomyces sp. NPDC001339 TaxID=3364563 RepID=UPI003684065F
MPSTAGSPVWAITSYFNPIGYRSRRDNYHLFRKNLQVPLVTVEHSTTGRFDLDGDDADILIHLDGGDVMWQKERLLNVALEAIPATCQAVAWLDCDVLLHNPDWAGQSLAKLDESLLVQPFSSAYEGQAAGDARLPAATPRVATRPSFAARYARRELSPEEIRTWRIGHDPVPIHCGYAWVGRLDLLLEHGFYDASIMGGGTRESATAAIGEIEAAARCHPRSRAQLDHFLTWARKWSSAIDGRIGYVEGELMHLWHGETADRGYGKRYSILTDHDFDPCVDIALTGGGCWKWGTPKKRLHEQVARYFTTRHEDGKEPKPT